ncbi:Asp-tRNA(Asn)/Glu-tRNA(Gln) amidotransferase subunit GatA, partial [Candidatus Micrarchaeota archaeon]|nr:Asp-tRNA(Asn)/Glu-tRNA(Gln) amidotransferase subunit GatA [Candidatus Micrarchaeota archaeon]
HDGLKKHQLSKKPRIGLIKEIFDVCSPEVSRVLWSSIKKLEAKGINYEEISLVSSPHALYAYYIIATAEASTNLAKYTGLRYGETEQLEGNFSEYFSTVRAKYLSEEEKRRIIIGTFVRSAGYRGKYYLKAKRVREKLRLDFSSMFKKFDALIIPSMPIIAPKFDEISKLRPHEIYALDICTAPPDLIGIPHISIPAGKLNSMPVGMQVMCDTLDDSKLFAISKVLEEYI